ncbi:glycosyltransferase family 39 protein [Gimesia aquarii]|uniref:Glycosyltransferase RgtA/B/C/D-like domain-containing protein n=1 Tax=Gimesia aquarii TaxID=2527964 RepID=A0A517VX01_9PLAN|nr:glycosyltransferase family 39 protein [Gimesia aquarii]QDT97529.1 hypothetical protein V144x_30040 [Gimesia aquarii]
MKVLHDHIRQSRVLWLLIVVSIALFLRISYLFQVAYWFDESFTLKMVEFPFLDMMHRNITDDDNPPFYYLVLKLWVFIFGNLLTAPRLLSVLCSMGTVVGTYFFIKEAYQKRTSDEKQVNTEFAAILAALLVALSPIHVDWAQQVRMYSMSPTFAVWSSYFLFRALFREKSGPWIWGLFVLTSLLGAYTHYFGLFIAMAQFLFALSYIAIQRYKKSSATTTLSFQPLLISGAAFYFCFLPWLLVFLDHRQRVTEKMPTPPLTWDAVGTRLCLAFDLQWAWPVTPEMGIFVGQFFFSIFLLLAIRRRPADYFLILASLLPFLAAIIVSQFMRTIFVPRYLIAAQLFALTAVAVVISDIPWKVFRWTGVFIVVLSMGWLTKEQYLTRAFDASLPGMQAAVEYLDNKREAGDLALVCNPMLFTTIVFYTSDRNQLYTKGTPRNYPYYQGTAVMRDDEYFDLKELGGATNKRVWTFDADRWLGGTWSVHMPSGWREVSRRRFKEFNAEFIIRCYERDLVK